VRSPIPTPLPELEPAASESPGLLTFSDLGDLHLEIDVPLCTVEMNVNELLLLQAGSVIALDRRAADPVCLLANGIPIARGEPRIHGEQFAVRITEVLTAEHPRDDETRAAR
jgi:flagellar motor switch protein FliN